GLLALGGYTGPIVRPEGGRGGPFTAVEVAYRGIGPGIAGGRWGGDLVGAYLDLILSHDFRVGPHEPVIGSRDRKAPWRRPVERLEPGANVVEGHDDLVPLLLHRLVGRALIRHLDAVVPTQCPAGQPHGDILLVARVDVLCFAQVDDHGLTGVGQLAHGHRLGL